MEQSAKNNPQLTNMKKTLTLDLNPAKLNNPNLSLNLLSTPEINSVLKIETPDLLKVDTPTIENLILGSNQLPSTPSPSILFPRNVTMEQESFVGGFVEALNNLHNGSNSQQGNTSDTNSNNSSNTFLPLIKEEPQTVPSLNSSSNNNNSPPMSPVDMEYQERMKLERKRQRNRLAASKCRSRKLERISKLEDKVKNLKSENAELGSIINQLKEQVGQIKVEVMQHENAGCNIMSQY